MTRFKVRYHAVPIDGSDHYGVTGISMTCSDAGGTTVRSGSLHQWGEWLTQTEPCLTGFFKARARIGESSSGVSYEHWRVCRMLTEVVCGYDFKRFKARWIS